ncbi:MAG: hypothetical protein U0270_11055 [Labilithrix sp.]
MAAHYLREAALDARGEVLFLTSSWPPRRAERGAAYPARLPASRRGRARTYQSDIDPGTNGGGSPGLGADALWSLLRLATEARRTDLVADLAAQIAALPKTATKHLRLLKGLGKR